MEFINTLLSPIVGFVAALIAIIGVLFKRYKGVAENYSVTWLEYGESVWAPDEWELPVPHLTYKKIIVENKTKRLLRDIIVKTNFEHSAAPKSNSRIEWDGKNLTILGLESEEKSVITFYPQKIGNNFIQNVYCDDVAIPNSDQSFMSIILSDRSIRRTFAGCICFFVIFMVTFIPWAVQKNDKNQEMTDKINYAITQYTGYLTTTFKGRELTQNEFKRNDLVRYIDENLSLGLVLRMNSVSTQDKLVELPSVIILDNGELDSYLNGARL